MKTNTQSAAGFESTYALIIRSEEKERGIFEGAAYIVVVVSALFSIWQVARQPIALPEGPILHTTSITQSANTNNHA
ncbi:MAG: hypothetical protein ACJ8M4_02450 [Chthoniobacterales bacterium]